MQKFEKKYGFLALESRAIHLCERLRVLRSIYAQPPLVYLFKLTSFAADKILKSTRELIISGIWK